MRMNHLVALLMVRGGEAFVTGAPRAVSVRRHLGVDEGLDFGVAPLVLAFAGVLAAAGKLQADAMSGDQGLAAYLRDGDGYNKSGYKPQKPNRDADAATAERLRLRRSLRRAHPRVINKLFHPSASSRRRRGHRRARASVGTLFAKK